MEGNNYATVRCTYAELRTAKDERVVTVTSKSIRRAGGIIPFVSERLIDGRDAELCRLYESGQLEKRAGGRYYYDNSEWTQEYIDELMWRYLHVKIYLTTDGYNMLMQQLGASRAYQISTMDLYAYASAVKDVKPVDVDPNPDPDPDPDPDKKENNKLFNTLLLLIAGILTMR